ncbi:hypothetical protein PInf_009755 [Phytophthora infestans]|nr:hypothetical protein PInf_009755 [Phytophthora infestans]
MRIVICPMRNPRNLINHRSPKKKNPYASRKKLNAPADSASDSRGEIAAPWSDDQPEEEYNQHELQRFMAKNPMMRIIQPEISGLLKGPVIPPPETTNKLEAVKSMLFLLKEAGTRPDPMAAKDLFDLDLETIQNTQSELFEMLSVLVGESQTQIKTEAKPAAGLLRHLSRGHGPDRPNNHAPSPRLQLGPSGAVLLPSRPKRAAKADVEAESPTLDDRHSENPSRLQTLFNLAMERFLKEQRPAQGRRPRHQ